MLKELIKSLYYKFNYRNSIVNNFCSIDKKSLLGYNTVLFNHVNVYNSKIDSYSYVQSNSTICNTNIGKFCSIGSQVYIGLASHPLTFISTSPVFYDNSQPLPFFFVKKSINKEIITQIGHDVWIGNNVLIKEGVNIGIGSIIGAGSIVTKDIPPYSIAFGNPCNFKRHRFDLNLIEELLKSNWWDYDISTLIKLSDFYENPKDFLNNLNNIT